MNLSSAVLLPPSELFLSFGEKRRRQKEDFNGAVERSKRKKKNQFHKERMLCVKFKIFFTSTKSFRYVINVINVVFF